MTKQEYIEQSKGAIEKLDSELIKLNENIWLLENENKKLIEMKKGIIPGEKNIDYEEKREDNCRKILEIRKRIEEIKNEDVKSIRSLILTAKRVYLAEELRKLRELDSVEEQKDGLKKLIDDLFITSTFGTANVPIHFMDLYLTKDMITTEINHEVYRDYGTPIFKKLDTACAELISTKGMKDKQVDYLTAKIIAFVRLQETLNHEKQYFDQQRGVEFVVETSPIEFDESSLIIYADMLKLLLANEVLNKDKELVKLATTTEGLEIANVELCSSSVFDEETQTYKEAYDNFYHSCFTEFVCGEDGNARAVKLKEYVATKEDIANKLENLEQTIMQSKEIELDNEL